MQSLRAALGSFARTFSKAAGPLAVGLGLLMTGCVGDTSTPRGIIQTAAYAAAHGDLEGLDDTLTGDAYFRYGSQAGIEELRAGVGKVLSIGTARLVSSIQGGQGGGHQGDILRNYQSEVAARTPLGAPIGLTVDTTCSVEVQTFHDPGSTGSCSLDPNDPRGPEICEPDTPPSDYEAEVQMCRVSQITIHAT